MMYCPRQPEESEINSDREMEEKPGTDNTTNIARNCSIAGQVQKYVFCFLIYLIKF